MAVIAPVMLQGISQLSLMTGLAINDHVPTLEFEICLVMVKFLIPAYNLE